MHNELMTQRGSMVGLTNPTTGAGVIQESLRGSVTQKGPAVGLSDPTAGLWIIGGSYRGIMAGERFCWGITAPCGLQGWIREGLRWD